MRKPKTGSWSMATDRELIALAKTKRLDAKVAHFQRSPRWILKKAMKLGLKIKGRKARRPAIDELQAGRPRG
jgi:hypothetical protein